MNPGEGRAWGVKGPQQGYKDIEGGNPKTALFVGGLCCLKCFSYLVLNLCEKGRCDGLHF